MARGSGLRSTNDDSAVRHSQPRIGRRPGDGPLKSRLKAAPKRHRERGSRVQSTPRVLASVHRAKKIVARRKFFSLFRRVFAARLMMSSSCRFRALGDTIARTRGLASTRLSTRSPVQCAGTKKRSSTVKNGLNAPRRLSASRSEDACCRMAAALQGEIRFEKQIAPHSAFTKLLRIKRLRKHRKSRLKRDRQTAMGKSPRGKCC